MIRPTTSIGMFCAAQMIDEPTTLGTLLVGFLALGAMIVVVLPDHTADHDCFSASQNIRQVARDQGTSPRSSSHGGSDATLSSSSGTLTVSIWVHCALVEVAFVRLCACDESLAA